MASNPDLRSRLAEMQSRHEQAIDEVSQDRVLEAGFSAEGTERARALVRSSRSSSPSIRTRSRRCKFCIRFRDLTPSPSPAGREES